LTRALIQNMVEGVVKEYEKKLEIQGLGYKANMKGSTLVLKVGYSHPVEMESPEGVDISVDNNIITVSGIDKELVGLTASKIRKVKPPEPYKGKGIRYVGEHVRRKPGKRVATGPSAF
ncbi:MAG: 50S ribosomal protein L6, partial [Candidatus Nealsonbacteria bacterium]|nr:50S ribosomal protein L6 [Candidatus Nealsonbacteria bacterium]